MPAAEKKRKREADVAAASSKKSSLADPLPWCAPSTTTR